MSQVSFRDLIPGAEYKIVYKNNLYNNTPYFGIYIGEQGDMQRFADVFRRSVYGKIYIGECLCKDRLYFISENTNTCTSECSSAKQ